MSKSVIMGGAIIGQLTALLLAEDGHEVTVLERDPAKPPADVEDAWNSWERTGVRQFRIGHWFHAGFKRVLDGELPQVVEALDEAGALRVNFLEGIPEEMIGGRQDGDEVYSTITGRRPVVEAVVARVAAAHPGIEVLRGQAVTSVNLEDRDGVPHLAALVTESGQEFSGDLIVDAAGRNSPTPRLLAEAGGRSPDEELEDSGFIYYGRSFKSADGSLPAVLGGLNQNYDSISILTLPADNGTWFVGIVAAGSDAEMRKVMNEETWTRVISSYPLVSHWLDGEPTSEVKAMGKIEDRIRRCVVDGQPVVTGYAAVGDAWACTNPSLGRGATIGLYHALALRDQMRADPAAQTAEWARSWSRRTEDDVEPWYSDGLGPDRLRLGEIEAQIVGARFEPDDELYEFMRCIGSRGMEHPRLLRALLDSALMIRKWSELLEDEELVEMAMAEPAASAEGVGLDRSQLLEILNA